MRLAKGLRLGDLLGGAAVVKSTLVDDLVAYWNLDEQSGTRADAVGSADLSDNNTVGYDTGKNGNAASFVFENVETLSAAFSNQTDVHVSMWVKTPDAGDNYNGLLFLGANAYAAGTPRLCAYYSAAETMNFESWESGGGQTLVGLTALDAAAWHFIEMVYDGTAKKAGWAVNGGAITLGSANTTPVTINAVIVGGLAVGSNGWDGLIDEVAIWSRVLTEDERAELYNSGDGKFYNATSENFEE